MADNITTQSATASMPPAGLKIATRSVTYSGDAAQHISPVGLVSFAGSDDAKTATDVALPTALGAGGGFKVEGVAAGTVIPISDGGGSLTIDAPAGTPVFVRLSTGVAAIDTIPISAASLPALAAGTALIGKVGIDQTTPGTTESVTAKQGAIGVGGVAWEQVGDVAHDAAGASVNPLAVGGYASAAAPSDVSADADVVRAWHLRNGAQAVVLTAAGALVGGDATNGMDVDVTRMAALVAGSALIGKVGIDQTTPGTTNAVSLVTTTRMSLEYAAAATVSITIASLASSSTFVAGAESAAIDNSSDKYQDYTLGGKITTGTTPTAGEIRVYVAGLVDDTVYPDVLDGTASAETFTSAGILDAATRLVARIPTDTTSNRTYWMGPTSVAAAFDGALPKKFVVYVSHSTVAVLHATGSNHALSVVGQYLSLH